MELNYAVVIRTIGKAGEKYQKLLDSIAALRPRPSEVIVVLPEGYDLPPQRLGWETFYHCPKGMVIQRLTGIEKCTASYALVCDDDVSFGSDFVEKLHRPVAEGLCKISAAPLYSFLPVKGLKGVSPAITGAAAPTLFHKDRYVSVLRTTGYSYNRHLKPERQAYYPSQSLAWTCFYAEVAALRAIELEQEVWLDANGYSAYDDQTMFYKAWLRGMGALVVADACYDHNDARTSTRGNKPAVLYCIAMNRIIFWHRFLYSMEHNPMLKLWTRVAFGYRMGWARFWALVYRLTGRYTKDDYAITKKGWHDGWQYIKSPAYNTLPSVR